MRKRRCGPAFVLTRRPYGRVRQLASPALPARYVATTCRTTSNPPDDPEPRPCFAPASCCPPLSRAAWPDPALATRHLFPGVSLAAIPVPARAAAHPLPRTRAARHRHHRHARGRGLAAQPWLHPGGGRREPGPGPRDGCARDHGLPQVPGRRGRLRAVHRHLSAGLEVGGVGGPGAREPAGQGGEAVPLGRGPRHAGAVKAHPVAPRAAFPCT